MVQLAATPYEIIIAQDWKSYTVYFSGEIDYAAAIEVSDKIDELVDACEDNLVFDLENVTFIDSEGMKILIKSAKKMRQKSSDLVISRCSKRARRSLRLAGIDQVLKIPEDSQEWAT